MCGQEDHIKPLCPKNPVKLTQMCVVPRQTFDNWPQRSTEMTSVKINGENLQALIDTGSTQTLVHRRHVLANIICTLFAVCMVRRGFTPLQICILRYKGRPTC